MPIDHERNQKVETLRDLSKLLDARFEGPFGFKFGSDGILGLIPGIGDLITTGVSFYIILQAALLGCGPAILIRMCGNVLLENLIDLLPVLGNFFDFFWKANLKNMELIDQHLLHPVATTWKSRGLILTICAMIFFVLGGSVYLTILLIQKLYLWIQQLS